MREQKSRIHWWMLAAAGLVALLLAPVASSWPDGLERVAEDHGFIDRAITLIQAPVPDYVLPGMSGSAATALAGLLGVAVTFTIVWGLTRLALAPLRGGEPGAPAVRTATLRRQVRRSTGPGP